MGNRGMSKAVKMMMMGGSKNNRENGWPDRRYEYGNDRSTPYNRDSDRDGYTQTDRFTDRSGRPHYDNGRYAPRSEYQPHENRNPMGFNAGSDMRYDGDRQRELYVDPMYAHHRGYEGQGHIRKEGDGYMMAGSIHSLEDDPHLDELTAKRWVDHMQNDDPNHPMGGKWSMEDAKTYAQKVGIPTSGQKFIDFYAMFNAMYSDYYQVAKEAGVANPDFFAKMAKAWITDSDAVPNKTALYYRCIAKK